MGGMVSGLTTRVEAAAIITFARAGIASKAASGMCMNGMMMPMPRPSEIARGTERWFICQRLGWRSRRANGRSSR